MNVQLSPKELHAVLWAVGQFTSGNAYAIKEMMLDGLSRSQAQALIRAEVKLYAPLKK